MRGLQAKEETEAEAKNSTVTAENHAEAGKASPIREGFAGESINGSGNKRRNGTQQKELPERKEEV